MKENSDITTLIQEIRKGISVLEGIDTFIDSFHHQHRSWSALSMESALAIAQVFNNYYTCCETIFIRISNFFENNLNKQKWHADLLEKMTISLPDIRERVLSDSCHSLLLEFLKFRHFCRYYFELDYDRDKLEFLYKKYVQVKPLIFKDLIHFIDFLESLGA